MVQGEQAESSILQALDAILDELHRFDVVVLIRGGGATADLSCFDSYELCAALAQFPLPVLTGIGHERDESVADLVAFKALKTPTAVAEFLNRKMTDQWEQLSDYASRLKWMAAESIHRQQLGLQDCLMRAKLLTNKSLHEQQQWLSTLQERLHHRSLLPLQQAKHRLELLKSELRLYNVEEQLKRGYSLTLRQGKIVKSVMALTAGDLIETRFRDGVLRSQVINEDEINEEVIR